MPYFVQFFVAFKRALTQATRVDTILTRVE